MLTTILCAYWVLFISALVYWKRPKDLGIKIVIGLMVLGFGSLVMLMLAWFIFSPWHFFTFGGLQLAVLVMLLEGRRRA